MYGAWTSACQGGLSLLAGKLAYVPALAYESAGVTVGLTSAGVGRYVYMYSTVPIL